MLRYIVIISLLFTTISLHSQSLDITPDADYYQLDTTHNIILIHDADLSDYRDLSNYSDAILTLEDQVFTFVNIPAQLTHNHHYVLNDGRQEYMLYFTRLPIISINSSSTILDEPKTKAEFTYVDQDQVLKSFIGIELRGGSSISYPKNTFDLEFWKDQEGEASRDVQFGSLRDDDDWILDGVYNEPLRIRSYVSHKLWLDLHTPYYLDQEEKAKAGVDIIYVEVFLNGEYNGVYLLSEQIDRKLLKLKSFKEEVRGELYKGNSVGVTTFSYLTNYNNGSREWDGYSIKYPKEDQWTDWSSLYNFTSFVINAPEADFQDSIWTKFHYDNYIDYFLYLNLLRLTDNTGKNIFLAKYDQDEPFFYVPWDLDGSLGLLWDGSYVPDTEGILTNNFHRRIIDANYNRYNRNIRNRWELIRDNVFSEESLAGRIQDAYGILTDNNIYHREAIVHGNYPFDEEAFDYIEDWLKLRIDYLDAYFVDRTTPTNELSSLTIKLYPNPSTDFIKISGYLTNSNSKYTITNIIGAISQYGLLDSAYSIDVSNLRDGLYFLRLEDTVVPFVKH